MAGERVGERDADLDLLRDLAEDLAEAARSTRASRTVSSASTIGMPARTNAADLAGEVHDSCRGTFCFVISISVKLALLADLLDVELLREQLVAQAVDVDGVGLGPDLRAVGVDGDVLELRSSVAPASDHVDGAEDLGDGGDVALDEPQRLGLERDHALGDREVAQLLVRGLGRRRAASSRR